MRICDWLSTLSFLAGVDPTDTHTTGTRSTGETFALPKIDSINVSDCRSG